MKLKNTI